MPPSALISSHASVRPFLNSTPSAAAKSVSGAACPTGIGSPSALAPSFMPASNAPPAPSAAALLMKPRRLGMMFGFARFLLMVRSSLVQPQDLLLVVPVGCPGTHQ